MENSEITQALTSIFLNGYDISTSKISSSFANNVYHSRSNLAHDSLQSEIAPKQFILCYQFYFHPTFKKCNIILFLNLYKLSLNQTLIYTRN